MKRALRLLRRSVHERRRILFYGYDWKQGRGRPDPHVGVYGSRAEIPAHFRKIVVPAPWMNSMGHRLERGEAKLLCYSADGQRLDAYGWVQDWRPFRRRFGAIAAEGTMLGPYWTDPNARGQGLYGRLLAHSLSLCPPERPVFIYTSPDNEASQRGIEKAGFRPLGEWDFRLWFGWWARMKRTSPPFSG